MTLPKPAQKHLLLEVPNYDRTGGTTKQPHTYLQLGAYPTAGSDLDRGDDLLDAVGLETTTDYYFKDDYRARNEQQHPHTVYWRDDGHQNVPSDPLTLTRQLRTRGGWRLHTDGNYISTTRGDRIDVIGGNYKLAVLGRVHKPGADIWGESYMESSGGHNRDATNTPGDRVMVAWNPERETWRTVDETVKGDVIERYQGITREWYECDTMISRVGSADAGAVIPPSNESDNDGAHAQKDFLGNWLNPEDAFGEGWRRTKVNPTISETVRAISITENTKVMTEAGSITEVTNLGTKTESTTASSIREATTVEGGVTISESTGTELAAVDTFEDRLLAGAMFGMAIYGQKGVSNAGGTTFNLDLVGIALNVDLALTLNIHGIGLNPAKGTINAAGAMRHIVDVGIGFDLGINRTLITAGVTLGAVVEMDIKKEEGETTAAKKAVATLFRVDLVGKWTQTVAMKAGGRVTELTVQGKRVES